MKLGSVLRRQLYNTTNKAKDNWRGARQTTFWTHENANLWDYHNAELPFKP